MRALTAQDGTSARELVRSTYGGTRHLVRTLELVELALGGKDPECLGLACATHDGVLEGLLLHGSIGGAAGVIKVHVLLGGILEGLTALITGVRGIHPGGDARMFVCELSVTPEHALATAALLAAGFSCEASIADYFTDGITLDVLVLRVVQDRERQLTSTRIAFGA